MNLKKILYFIILGLIGVVFFYLGQRYPQPIKSSIIFHYKLDKKIDIIQISNWLETFRTSNVNVKLVENTFNDENKDGILVVDFETEHVYYFLKLYSEKNFYNTFNCNSVTTFVNIK